MTDQEWAEREQRYRRLAYEHNGRGEHETATALLLLVGEVGRMRPMLNRYMADASDGYEYKIMATERIGDYIIYRQNYTGTEPPLSLDAWWRSPLSLRTRPTS